MVKTNRYYIQLCKAITRGNTKDVHDFLNNVYLFPDKTASAAAALNTAILSGNLDIVRPLITNQKHPADPNEALEGHTPIMLAVKLGNTEMVKLLLYESLMKVNVDVKEDNDTPLTLAIRMCNADIVRMLLQAGADPNVKLITHYGRKVDLDKVESALNFAVRLGHVETVQLLSNYGAEITLNGCPYAAIYAAITKAHSVILDSLFAHKLKYNQIYDNVRWANCMIVVAISRESESCLAVLLRRGIYRYRANEASPCSRAACGGKISMVKLLMAFNPWSLQEDWLVKGAALPTLTKCNKDFAAGLIADRKQPPRLDILCRFNIIQQLGYNFLQKAEELPLPRVLLEFVQFKNFESLHIP